MERFALPDRAAEYADAPIAQYWDDTEAIGVEFKQRIVRAFASGDIVRDAFVLFDREATWADAGDHVLGWGSTVLDEEGRLFGLLEGLGKRPDNASSPRAKPGSVGERSDGLGPWVRRPARRGAWSSRPRPGLGATSGLAASGWGVRSSPTTPPPTR